jgi:hypothetical protein
MFATDRVTINITIKRHSALTDEFCEWRHQCSIFAGDTSSIVRSKGKCFGGVALENMKMRSRQRCKWPALFLHKVRNFEELFVVFVIFHRTNCDGWRSRDVCVFIMRAGKYVQECPPNVSFRTENTQCFFVSVIHTAFFLPQPVKFSATLFQPSCFRKHFQNSERTRTSRPRDIRYIILSDSEDSKLQTGTLLVGTLETTHCLSLTHTCARTHAHQDLWQLEMSWEAASLFAFILCCSMIAIKQMIAYVFRICGHKFHPYTQMSTSK